MYHVSGKKSLGLILVASVLFAFAGTAIAEDEVDTVQQAAEKVAVAADSVEAADQDAPGECGDAQDVFEADFLSLTEPEPAPTTCTATAYCHSGTVSCTGCPANRQHASCPSQRGWVECAGNRTYCPPCPPPTCNPSCKSVCWPTGGVCINGNCICY